MGRRINKRASHRKRGQERTNRRKSGKEGKLSGNHLAKDNIENTRIAELSREVHKNPNDWQKLTELANLFSVAADYGLAYSTALRAIDLNPVNPVGHYLAAYCLEQMDRIGDSLSQTEAGLKSCPEDGILHVHHAHLLGRLKRYDEALIELEGVCCAMGMDESDQMKIVTVARQRGTHERGMILDRTGRYDEAFACMLESGRLTGLLPSSKQYDRAVRFRKIRSYHALLGTGPALRTIPGEHLRPVPFRIAFLVGFPRSGTTMTEQILAAHPDIRTGDEWSLITEVGRAAVNMTGGGLSAAALVQRLSVDHVNILRELYIDMIIDFCNDSPPGELFVDKMPLNIIDLPLMQLVFPEAQVITVLRDPRDVCLSCFMQDFRLNNSMIHFLTLEDTISFYEAVMGLYLEIKPKCLLDVVEVRYEDTVSDLEGCARRLLEHLGVGWNDDVLSFHEKAKTRLISTPSAAAVREPIHRRAVARWKNYASYFEQYEEELQPFVAAFGYGEDCTFSTVMR